MPLLFVSGCGMTTAATGTVVFWWIAGPLLFSLGIAVLHHITKSQRSKIMAMSSAYTRASTKVVLLPALHDIVEEFKDKGLRDRSEALRWFFDTINRNLSAYKEYQEVILNMEGVFPGELIREII